MKTMMRIFGITILLASAFAAQQAPIPFDEAHWNLAGARVVEHLGRLALMGTAILKNIDFENGVIEYDQAVGGGRSYPGVMFRSRPDGSWERFYIRPHRSGRVAPSLYPDVLQYVPSWNRADSWQLYSGDGYTSGAIIPADKWFHVKIEVAGDRARVYLDHAPQPNLEIPRLRHGRSRGGIALMGPVDGSAFYSHFSVREDNALDFGPARRRNPALGFICSCQVSQSFRFLDMDGGGSLLPEFYASLKWRDLTADEDGLVDMARVQARSGQPDTVFLKTVISAARAEVRPYRFGYSDIATVYLNGLKVFIGNSQYQGRDPSFLGIIGVNDVLYLPLRSGDNEVVVELTEMSGGWGLLMQDAEAELRTPGLADLWKTARRFAVPESAVYDPARQMIYVSNYDPFTPSGPEGRQTISKIGLQGGEPQILARGLRNPTGLCLFKDRLYAVEPDGVAEIDILSGSVTRRIPVPGASFLNDIAVDGAGRLYVTDPSQGAIHRISGRKVEVLLQGPEVRRPNGIWLAGNTVAGANNGDGRLKSADLADKRVSVLADLSGGIIDGLTAGPDDSLLVSHNEGRIFQVKASGEVTLLFDRTAAGIPIADFAFVPEKNMFIIPTFTDNRVMAMTWPAMGSTRTAALPAVPNQTILANTARSSASGVLEKYAKSVGGEALSEVLTIKRRGTLIRGRLGKTPFEIINRSPDKWIYRQVFAYGDQVCYGSDGREAWLRDTQKSEILSAAERVDLQLLLDIGAPAMMKDIFPDVSLKESSLSGGEGNIILRAQTRDGVAMELAFDPKTGYLVRAGDIAFEDYRAEGPLILPHRVYLGDDPGTGLRPRLEISEVRFGEPVDAGIFERKDFPLPLQKSPLYTLRKQTAPDRAALAACAGVYQHPADARLQYVVSLQGDHLMIEQTGWGKRIEIKPESSWDYFIRFTNQEFHFVADAAGRVERVEIGADRGLSARKIK